MWAGATTVWACAPPWGIASSQSTLSEASALRRKLRSLPCSSFSAAIRYAGFASETGDGARMTEVVGSLVRPRGDVLRCASVGDSSGFAL